MSADQSPGEHRALILIKSTTVLMVCLAGLVFVVGCMVGYTIFALERGRSERNTFQNEQRHILCDHVDFGSPFCKGVKEWGDAELRRRGQE